MSVPVAPDAGARPKAVISISSHVARGSVGNRAIVFALETLGFPVWAVNTVSLPYHPGHGKAQRIVPDAGEFAQFLDDLAASPWIGEVGAVATGYMADAGQAETVGKFIDRLKAGNSELIHLCDPVIGDRGGLYVGQETAEAIRDHLLSRADIATPNVHELAWLAGGLATDDAGSIAEAARQLPPSMMIVTSAPAMMLGHVGNLLVHAGSVVMAEHMVVDGPPNGPGDLMAGLFLAHIMLGQEPVVALEKTTASVFETVRRAAGRGSDELMLAEDKSGLIRSLANVHLRNMVMARAAK